MKKDSVLHNQESDSARSGYRGENYTQPQGLGPALQCICDDLADLLVHVLTSLPTKETRSPLYEERASLSIILPAGRGRAKGLYTCW